MPTMTLSRARTWRNDWRPLWSAAAISTLGDGAFLAALPLVAATMTDDPRLIAGVTAWGTLPWLLTALPAGALVDRMDARRTLIGLQLAQGLMVAALAVLSLMHAGGLVVLYLVAFGVGVAETMAKVALQKMVPAVVPREQLEMANGRQNATVFACKEFLGAPLGALLLTVSTPLPFWVNAASFGVSALLVSRVRMTARGNGQRRPLWREISEGVRYVGQHRLLRTFVMQAAAGNFAFFMATSTLVLFAKERLGVTTAAYGVLIGLMAVGGIAGSLLAGRIVARFGGRRVVRVTIFVAPVTLLAVGLFANSLVMVAAFVSMASFATALWNVSTMAVRQRIVPPELLGRVTSTGLLVVFGAQPLGAIAGGLVAASFGLAAPWLVAGGLRLVASILAAKVISREWTD